MLIAIPFPFTNFTDSGDYVKLVPAATAFEYRVRVKTSDFSTNNLSYASSVVMMLIPTADDVTSLFYCEPITLDVTRKW